MGFLGFVMRTELLLISSNTVESYGIFMWLTCIYLEFSVFLFCYRS